jgi:site-specific recombinase XerC
VTLTAMSQRKRIPTPSKPTRRRPGRGPVTKPGYHAGRVPSNKGRRVPTPILSRDEVGAVFDAFRVTRPVDARDKALSWLAYHYRLKLVQLVAIDTSGYDAARRGLTVPATTRHPASTISLDSMTTELLDRWMAVRKSLGIRPFAPLFCTAVADSLGRPRQNARVFRSSASRGLARSACSACGPLDLA